MDANAFFSQQAAVFTPEDISLAQDLLAEGQSHLFENWKPPGEGDDIKRGFLQSLRLVNESYPGGLIGYIRNARILLAGAASEANPFEGYTPAEPDMVDLSEFGPEYEEAEALGFAAFAETAVVLVAGGLGERLGYHGIKLDIPVEVTENTPYLGHYASVILAASQRLGRDIPLIIMTSRDTHDATVATLAANKRFGLAESQVILLRQELVPALSDIDARLALDGPCQLALKPHGHGDIHILLHTSGTAQKLAEAGVRYLLFIQDTNAQSLNAAFAAIGTSEKLGYDFNSIAVNRIPGEAVGGIARLVKPGHPDLTLNVEYNQLDPLLRATVSPEGDVPNERGFSLFPGNINLLVIRLAPYLKVLQSSGGIIAEFVNPKFADSSRTTFKKPARLETMMQDLPKLFVSGEKVGVTVFDRTWCFSACKNALADAAAKVEAGGPPESASSAENDFYATGRRKLLMAGMRVTETPPEFIRRIPFVTGPRVILRPSFALTLADVKARVRGGEISGDSTLILEGDVTLENLTVPDGASVKISGTPAKPVVLKDYTVVAGPGYKLEPLSDEEMANKDVPEYLRIRGYRIVDLGAHHIRFANADSQ
jgi:UDP-sugar pyrophosphorylase